MQYRSVDIKVLEAPAFEQKHENQNYTVGTSKGLVFAAHCVFGTSYAKSAPDAVEGCKALIDRATYQ